MSDIFKRAISYYLGERSVNHIISIYSS